jgi:hypothetical protein
MNETEARQFINAQVSKELSARFWKAVGIIGVGTIAALIGIYRTTLHTADLSARAFAKQAVDEAINASKLDDDIQSRLKSQSEIVTGMDRKIGEMLFQIKSWSDVASEAKHSDPKHLKEIIHELNSLTEPARNLPSRVEALDHKVTDTLNNFRVRLGAPVEWNLGTEEKPEPHIAKSSGFVVLTSGGNGVASAVGGFKGQKGRAFYEFDPERNRVFGTAGVSHVLPASKGDEFETWGNPNNIHVYFIPLELSVN